MILDEIILGQQSRRLARIVEHEIFKHYGVKMFWNLIWSDNGKLATIQIPFDPEKHPETAQYIRDGLEFSNKKKIMNPCAEIPLNKSEIGTIMHPIPKQVLQDLTARARENHSKRMDECLTMIGEGLLAAANQGLSETTLTLPWDAKVEMKIRALYNHLLVHITMTQVPNQAKVMFKWATYQEEKNTEFARRYGSTQATA